jgi:hypothetical protein
MRKRTNIIFTIILILGLLIIMSTLIYSYNIDSNNMYSINSQNLIEGGGFENFNEAAKDCCNKKPNTSKVFASKSEDSIEGDYSLNLTSKNQCSCANFDFNNFSNNKIYIASFYYKGENAKFCNWVSGDNKCLPIKELQEKKEWTIRKEILSFTENSLQSSLFFYADSDGTKTITNLYDDLLVYELNPIKNANYIFNSEEEYVIKTKADNNVNGEIISEIEDGEAYFLVQGEPKVTIKFPLTELIIMLIMLIIIIRLTKHEKH